MTTSTATIDFTGLRSKRTIREEGRSRDHISFACRDRLNREIGIIVDRSMVDFTAMGDTDAQYTSYWRMQPGTYFAVDAQAARNGILYGASQRMMYFATEAEREAYIAKRIAASRKAAQKKEA
jgi:hypothetical protein